MPEKNEQNPETWDSYVLFVDTIGRIDTAQAICDLNNVAKVKFEEIDDGWSVDSPEVSQIWPLIRKGHCETLKSSPLSREFELAAAVLSMNQNHKRPRLRDIRLRIKPGWDFYQSAAAALAIIMKQLERYREMLQDCQEHFEPVLMLKADIDDKLPRQLLKQWQEMIIERSDTNYAAVAQDWEALLETHPFAFTSKGDIAVARKGIGYTTFLLKSGVRQRQLGLSKMFHDQIEAAMPNGAGVDLNRLFPPPTS